MNRSVFSILLAIYLVAPASAQKVMAPAKESALRAMLPALGDREFDGYLKSDRVIWYTNEEIPAAFQHESGNGYIASNFHSAFHNFSGDPSDENLPGKSSTGGLSVFAGGHANGEFPWNVAPGGAATSPGVNSFKGLLLPADDSGRTLPIVWFTRDLPGRSAFNPGSRLASTASLLEGPPSNLRQVYAWTFPVGTVFVEALTMKRPDATDVVFEVRFRIRESDAWGVEVFRPCPTVETLVAALERLDAVESTALRRRAIEQLKSDGPIASMRLVDSRHNRKRAFDVTSGVYPLPTLATDDVLSLLDRPFSSSLGEVFKRGSNGVDALAPTNDSANFSIVPRNYQGGFVGNDRFGCIKCHDSTNRHATEFEVPRGWYGRVRGSDGIFSFHPIDPRSISYNGGRVAVVFRSEFLSGGILERFDPSRHSRAIYSLIPGLY